MSQEPSPKIKPESIEFITISEKTTGETLSSHCRIRHAEKNNSTLTVELGKNPSYGYVPPQPSPLANLNLSNIGLIKMVNHTTEMETTPMRLLSMKMIDDSCLHVQAIEKNPHTSYCTQ